MLVYKLVRYLFATGLTPVHVATREGCIEVLKFLFQMRANKNAPVSVLHQWLYKCVCVCVVLCTLYVCARVCVGSVA